MRTKLLTWLGVALSAGLLYHLFLRFDLGDAARALREASPAWLLAGALVYTLLFALRGYRWSLLLAHEKEISARTATEVFAVGFLANNVLPARLGDVARAYVLARRERLGAAATFSSVMLERIFDGVTVVLLMSLVLWLQPPRSDWIRPFALLSAAIFVAAIVVCALVAWNQRRVSALIGRLFAWLPGHTAGRLQGLVGRLGRGLHSLTSASQTVRVAGLSLSIWLIETSVYVLVGQAYDLDVPFLGMVLVMAVLTLGLTVPSGPGFVGLFEGLVVRAVELFGVTGPKAIAFALTVHLVHFLPGTLLGLVFSWRSGLKLRDLRDAADREDEGGAEPVTLAGDPAGTSGAVAAEASARSARTPQ
jgi:uncharacterized protein (TIRG00374 family)